MHIIHETYIELPAPLETTHAVIGDPATWSALPSGAERLGTMWRRDGELYTLLFDGWVGDSTASHSHPYPLQLRWTGAPVTGKQGHLQLSMTLYDAIISTHALISVKLFQPGVLAWPWRIRRTKRQIAAIVQECIVAIHQRVYEHAHKPRPIAALGVPLTESVAVGITESSDSNDGEWQTTERSPSAPPNRETLFDVLRARYPRTVTAFESMDALEHLDHVWQMERSWQQITRGEHDQLRYVNTERVVEDDQSPQTDFDLIYAGGGLGLLHAAVMAKHYGRRVMVFDRGEVGCAHREWNISRRELQALVDLEVVTWEELNKVVMREYRNGLVRFYHSPFSQARATDLWLPNVLSLALDSSALLQLMCHKVAQAGGVILSRRCFRRVIVPERGPLCIEVELDNLDNPRAPVESYRARLLLDGMGTTSPLGLIRHAGKPFAAVCPTVGTVTDGLAQGVSSREYDPDLGDILISVADAQRGRQLIWEGFPGRNNEMTVYLFYYATLSDGDRHSTNGIHVRKSARRNGNGAVNHASFEQSPPYSLCELFEQYFELLPDYKQPGPDFKHLRPVYGYIPARHSMDRQESPLLRGVLPVGDSAAQQSPLTFCGFGSHVRNLKRTTSLLEHALRRNLTEPQHLRHINAFQANVSLNWVFSRFMYPWGQPQQVNHLQNVFLNVLNDVGADIATRFFQDQMRWGDYYPIIAGLILRYQGILFDAMQRVGANGIARWLRDYLCVGGEALVAAGARGIGAPGERTIIAVGDRIAPTAALIIRARYAEWRAMGWIT